MKIGVFFIFALVVCTSVVQTLKCQTDEGITEEEARKMVKKCIRKMSDDFDGKNYREYDSYDSNEDGGEQYKKPSYNSWNNKNNRIQQPGNYDMRTGNHESRGGHYGSNYARLKRQEYLNQNDHHGYNNNQRSGHNNQGNTSSDNERSCLFQCFFHELRAVSYLSTLQLDNYFSNMF